MKLFPACQGVWSICDVADSGGGTFSMARAPPWPAHQPEANSAVDACHY